MRHTLEDEGFSRRTAESVAKGNDVQDSASLYLFGKDMKGSSVSKSQSWMVVDFFVVNLVKICSILFQVSSCASLLSMLFWTESLSGVVMTPPLEPFKVAGNGLDELLF
ncbi:hypothetical protein N7451_004909 [Penicillium sp. IBT 35674x]|nr:hypothetical protein N7451_004909 [Penicillium sp. IBT 35674x]